MALNKATLKLIASFEALRLEAYPDPGSKDGKPWTIGYGHTRGVQKGDIITKEQAIKYLAADVKDAEFAVRKYVKVQLNDNQYGALVSLVFNIGAGAFARSTLLKRINAGRLEDVPQQFMLWVNNDGKRMRGLVRRRAAEVELWSSPTVAQPTEIESKSKGVETKEELSGSRTIGGAGTAAGGGAIVLVEPIKEATEVLTHQQEAMSAGSIVSLVIGLVIIGGALLAVYARWDDAGRPQFCKKK